MTRDEMLDRVRGCMGQRVRVTCTNGVGREFVTPAGIVGMWREHLTIGGKIIGGEYSGPVLVEVRGDNGRYAPVTA